VVHILLTKFADQGAAMKMLTIDLLWMFTTTLSLAGEHFSHKYINFDLPDGWTASLANESELPHVGKISSTDLPGTSITVDCYRGAFNSKASTRIRALNTIAAAYPAGQEMVKDKSKIKTQKGKGTWESWKGYVQVDDQVAILSSPMASIKTKHCWLVMIGFTPEKNQEKLEKDFLAILKTAR
jgi:hypothetical protein